VDAFKSNKKVDVVVCIPNKKLGMNASNHIYFNDYIVNKNKPIAQEFTISCVYAIASNNYSLSVTIFKYFIEFSFESLMLNSPIEFSIIYNIIFGVLIIYSFSSSLIEVKLAIYSNCAISNDILNLLY
jgi:hypothetical protein